MAHPVTTPTAVLARPIVHSERARNGQHTAI
jgi:hypothetical protein